MAIERQPLWTVLLLAATACSVSVTAVRSPPATAASAAPPERIVRSLADDLGCSGVPGARVIGADQAITAVDLGLPQPAYVVEPDKVSCSVPTSTAVAGEGGIVVWTGGPLAPVSTEIGIPALDWHAAAGAIVGAAEAGFCEDAPEQSGTPPTGACGFRAAWDAAKGALAVAYAYDASANRLPPPRALVLAAPFDRAAEAEMDCKGFSHSRVSASSRAVIETDIDQDGHNDVILDFAHMGCTVSHPPVCGTGGCPIQVWMARPRGGYRKALDRQLLSWRVPGPPGILEAAVHGGECGLTGSEECVGTFSWDPAKARFATHTTARPYNGVETERPR